ncbi:hypothetical protein TIFTF001_044723 [Ficus carica]|uniref:Uncharacterized protein n=1 Tax=Ficus carica TaxID=3494 RepID=A0AA88DBH8_FICCA|nr:hypothetical protein TIFTF001_044723 [Ficus carica]
MDRSSEELAKSSPEIPSEKGRVERRSREGSLKGIGTSFVDRGFESCLLGQTA